MHHPPENRAPGGAADSGGLPSSLKMGRGLHGSAHPVLYAITLIGFARLRMDLVMVATTLQCVRSGVSSVPEDQRASPMGAAAHALMSDRQWCEHMLAVAAHPVVEQVACALLDVYEGALPRASASLDELSDSLRKAMEAHPTLGQQTDAFLSLLGLDRPMPAAARPAPPAAEAATERHNVANALIVIGACMQAEELSHCGAAMAALAGAAPEQLDAQSAQLLANTAWCEMAGRMLADPALQQAARAFLDACRGSALEAWAASSTVREKACAVLNAVEAASRPPVGVAAAAATPAPAPTAPAPVAAALRTPSRRPMAATSWRSASARRGRPVPEPEPPSPPAAGPSGPGVVGLRADTRAPIRAAMLPLPRQAHPPVEHPEGAPRGVMPRPMEEAPSVLTGASRKGGGQARAPPSLSVASPLAESIEEAP
jgi:hypothetical protein